MCDDGLTREFDCADCGIHVVAFAWPPSHDPTVCVECAWLRTIADPAERERVRQHLQRRAGP